MPLHCMLHAVLHTRTAARGCVAAITDATVELGQVTSEGRFNPKITFQQSILHGRVPYDDESYEPGYGGALQQLIQWTQALLRVHEFWTQDHEADGTCPEDVERDALQHEWVVAAQLMQMSWKLQGDVVTFLYLVHTVLQDVMQQREAELSEAQLRAARWGLGTKGAKPAPGVERYTNRTRRVLWAMIPKYNRGRYNWKGEPGDFQVGEPKSREQLCEYLGGWASKFAETKVPSADIMEYM